MSLCGRYYDIRDTFDGLRQLFPFNREPSNVEKAAIQSRCRQLAQYADELAAAIETGEEYEL